VRVSGDRMSDDDTGLPLAMVPEACSWTRAQMLDADLWPEG